MLKAAMTFESSHQKKSLSIDTDEHDSEWPKAKIKERSEVKTEAKKKLTLTSSLNFVLPTGRRIESGDSIRLTGPVG